MFRTIVIWSGFKVALSLCDLLVLLLSIRFRNLGDFKASTLRFCCRLATFNSSDWQDPFGVFRAARVRRCLLILALDLDTWDLVYTLARKYYIHHFLFSISFPESLHFRYKNTLFWGGKLISRKLHIKYSFVIQKFTWKNCLGISLGKSHFSYMK